MPTRTSPSPSTQGIWIPLITPFYDGRLDEASLRRLVTHYSKAGVSGFILAATTGESPSLDEAEARRLVDVVQETNTSKLPVFLGHTGASTHKLVREIKHTNGWDIDGYLIAAPYYVKPPQEGLYQHFRTVARETALPILIYNIPYRTCVNIANDTMLRLAQEPNIVGVKDCCAVPEQTKALIEARPPGFSVLVGDDANFFRDVSWGADGGILASAHVGLESYRNVLSLVRQGRTEEARAVWDRFSDINPLLFAEPNPSPVKFWLHQQKLIASPEVRLPMMPVSEGLGERIVKRMALG